MAGLGVFGSKEIGKKYQKNKLLVFLLFAQVLSAKLPQSILLVLSTVFIVVASESVVHSVFRERLER